VKFAAERPYAKRRSRPVDFTDGDCDNRSKQHPILDMNAENVEPLGKHVPSPPLPCCPLTGRLFLSTQHQRWLIATV